MANTDVPANFPNESAAWLVEAHLDDEAIQALNREKPGYLDTSELPPIYGTGLKHPRQFSSALPV